MKDNRQEQQEQLFTELTPEEQAAINGGELNLFDIRPYVSTDNNAASQSMRENQLLGVPVDNHYVSSDTGAKFVGITFRF